MDLSKMIFMMIIKISHFADFEQVKQYYQQNSLGRNRMPRHFFFEATTLVKASTSSELYPSTRLFFECLGNQFFNSSHVTYGTPCHARGHSHSPKEAKDLPRGEKYFRHMPPPTYLIYFSPKGLY